MGLNVLLAVTDGRLQIASRLRNFCLLTSRADCRMYGRIDRCICRATDLPAVRFHFSLVTVYARSVNGA